MHAHALDDRLALTPPRQETDDADSVASGRPTMSSAVSASTTSRASKRARSVSGTCAQRPVLAEANARLRVKRGCASSKEPDASSFRANRGGDQLQLTSWSCDPFDQANYASRQSNRRGSCEGWIREALRRLDHDSGPHRDLTSVVRHMRSDANTLQGDAASVMFERVDRYQSNLATLRLRRYSTGQESRIESDDGARDTQTAGASHAASPGDAAADKMFDSLSRRLSVGCVAHIRLGAQSAETGERRAGHALLVQRPDNNSYIVFDANNGAFVYRSFQALRAGLSRYMNAAFSDQSLRLIPESIRYYTLSVPAASQGVGAERPEQPVPPVDARPGPDEPIPQPVSGAREAYQRRATRTDGLSSDVLAAAAGEGYASINADHGLVMSALANIALGASQSLSEASESIREQLADWAERHDAMGQLDALQKANEYGPVGTMFGYLKREGSGAVGLTSANSLVADLERAFGNLQVDDDSHFGYRTEFAVVRLDFRGSPEGRDDAAARRHPNGHSIAVQRMHASPDFRLDQYELYDPDAGVFRYASFADLTNALHGLFDLGYRELGGIARASTFHYADTSACVAMPGNDSSIARPHPSTLSNLPLYVVEPMLRDDDYPSSGPPTSGPPPPYHLDPPGDVSHASLKRSTDPRDGRKPNGLFRPSTISPQALRSAGGFDCLNIKLGRINLRVHDMDLAANPRAIDSAGYLGTFRTEATALSRMPCKDGDGYLYYVAPTPNMVNVNATLAGQAREPRNEEFAAMGRIDFGQIRGWRPVKGGVAGEYVRNPDYRWDIFDQTSSAGAQPVLSRIPVDSSVWREQEFRPFVSEDGTGAKGRFNVDPDVAHILFYDQAQQAIRNLQDRQSAGLDYRGPLRMHAYGAKDRSNTQIYLDEQNNVYVNTIYAPSARRSGTRHDFVFDSDGRFHVSGDYQKVLRVGGDGYVYLGDVPTDPASLNGVFEYDGRYLIHMEDHKFLTTGLSSYTPFLDVNRGARSQWQLRNSGTDRAVPPRVNVHTFDNSSAGTASRLYAFHVEPNSALPPSATHFVTSVPGLPTSGKFLTDVNNIPLEQFRSSADWLRSNNAARLFKDGFYAVADIPGQLEVRKLDGTPVWRVAGLNGDLKQARLETLAPLSSSYQMRDETWSLVRQRERRRERVLAQMNHMRSLM